MRYADIVLPLAQPLYTFAVAEGGIALYVGMAVSSAVGMAWVGKKKD